MSLVRVDVETIVVGGGPLASLVVLKPRKSIQSDLRASSDHQNDQDKEYEAAQSYQPLPIRLGITEAASIGMGVENPYATRPMTHDLFYETLRVLGTSLSSVVINGVEGTTFFARLNLVQKDGTRISVDARPSDAIALAIRAKAPIFVEDDVLLRASVPDFEAVRRDENQKSIKEFQTFLEHLTPDDFLSQN